MIDVELLRGLVDAFDPPAHDDEIAAAETERAKVLERFPRDAWPSMPVTDYALGQKDRPETFCWWMEFGARHLGSIKGGNAKKHLVYYQRGADRWWYDDRIYDSIEDAWQSVRGAFLRAFELGDAGEFEAVDTLAPLKPGPALTTKTLHVYFPDDVLPICSHAHLRHFLRELREPRADEPGLGTVTLNRLLLAGLRASGLVEGWSTKQMERLLYSSGIDPFVEPLQTGPIPDPAAFIRSLLTEEGADDRVQARRASEDEARRLLDERAGSMSEAEFRELLRLFNVDFHEGKPTSQRFVPAFFGHTANGLVAHLDAVNAFTSTVWRGTDAEALEAASAVLDDRKSLPSAGSTYPTMLLYLRSPEEHSVWSPSTDAGLRRLSRYSPQRPPARGGAQEYTAFATAARELTERHEIPPELLDHVLAAASKAEARGTEETPRDRAWIFQANPEIYDIDGALRALPELTWVTRQSAHDIHVGDRVYLWRSGAEAGVVAVGRVATEPAELPGDVDDPFVRAADNLSATEERVVVSVEHVLRQPVLRRDLLEHPILQDLRVITQRTGTNFAMTAEQDSALWALVETDARVGDPNLTPANDTLAHSVYIPRDWLQSEVVDLLAERRQVVFFGPPGTGKTYVAQKIAEHVTARRGRWELIQFHPSYSYEDFFEGYRPIERDGELLYELRPGPLRRIAAAAKRDPANPYVLVVDEINRGNVAKIFGELLFLLEYRDRSIALQYSPDEQFSLPPNLYVMGTMNTADRSIALVDAALRRRFYFVPFLPTEPPVRDVLGRWLSVNQLDDAPDRLLRELNRRIGENDFAIGPSYLMTNDGSPPDVDRVWRHAILPLLDEYYYGTGRDVKGEFGLDALRAAPGSQADTEAPE